MRTTSKKPVKGLGKAIIVLLAFIHLVGAVGLPVPLGSAERVVRKAKSGKPFPCQQRPCGCLTYEQCWAGDCCCFTLSQKIAWARENGEEVPSIAVAKAGESEIEEETPPCCCEKKKPSCCDSENGTCGRCAGQEGADCGGCCDQKREKSAAVSGCCSGAGAKASCCGAKSNSGPAQDPSDCSGTSQGGEGIPNSSGWKWTLGEWVKKCRGDGNSGPISLLPPGLPVPLILSIPSNSGFTVKLPSLRQDAVRVPSEPQPPPPKS